MALLAAALSLAATAPARAEPATWTIRDKDSTILLFGSVHVLPAGLDWRPDALDAALAQADDLWFETPADPAQSGAAAQLARQYGYLGADQSLIDQLTPKGREQLKRVCVRLGIAPAAIDRLKPWLADISLSVAVLATQGASADSGVERILTEAAPATAQRRYFETTSEQILMFAQAPTTDQLASLEDTLRQLDEDPAFFERLIGVWLDGDQTEIVALGVAPLKTVSPVLYQRLLVERNRRWAEVIAQRLAGSGETVIVVGAAHLAGPDGVPALLRARGIVVEGP